MQYPPLAQLGSLQMIVSSYFKILTCFRVALLHLYVWCKWIFVVGIEYQIMIKCKGANQANLEISIN